MDNTFMYSLICIGNYEYDVQIINLMIEYHASIVFTYTEF